VVLKKILSIFLLLLYVNAAFGIGLDCHYCGEKLVKVKLHGFGHEACKCTTGQMSQGCCHDKTIACKTDQHKLLAPATTAPFLLTEYNAFFPLSVPIEVWNLTVVPPFSYYYFKRNITSREILSLIHILRI
jgi:hypothetical protein